MLPQSGINVANVPGKTITNQLSFYLSLANHP